MKNNFIKLIAAALISQATAQTGPEITSWVVNTTAATGYNNIPSNVQKVQYSANDVYISASCIPSYSIGPWASNPNTPVNQNFVYRITRHPVQNTGTAVNIGLGHIGVWSNGVSIFNASDGMSYNNAGAWNRNAYYWEGVSFDECLGHPAPNGEYHHHVSPKCLYNQEDSTHHSPIIGYAFDGFPVYGAYAFTYTNGTGPIRRMASSYVLSTATTRANGPGISAQYPSGCFMEDYAYAPGSGDLDQRNGRFCITPEYPAGTYAYFATIDGALKPVFPYTFYKTYYGTVQSGNTGPSGGHNTITEQVTTYDPSVGLAEHEKKVLMNAYPNPASDKTIVFIESELNNLALELRDILGRPVLSQENIQPYVSYEISLNGLSDGVYFLRVTAEGFSGEKKILKTSR